MVGKIVKLTGIIMDKIRAGVVILKSGKLSAEERDGGVGSKVITDNFSGLKLNDKEDIESFKAKDIHGEEVRSKEGEPMGRKEAFP
jgi:hypothetical protein